MSANSSNKTIAINTLILYAKLIITIIISFVTSRLVLQVLGASDYGLYNVVGGIVALLNTLGTSMVATSYRYMTVEIGKGKDGNPNKIYNTIFTIHIGLALLLIILGESVGVFYITHYLNVSVDRVPDALFILHLSLLTTAFVVISVPMNGLIIAREKFLFIAVVESFDVLLKLSFIILLQYIDGNKIRIYAIIMAIVQLGTPIAYQIYCRLHDKDIVRWNLNKNKDDYKEVVSFTSWILIGATAVMGQVQGASIIINYFFGTVLNASFGLATQVRSALIQFSNTLRQAFIPQIMKNQQDNEERSLQLVYMISRYSYLCMSIISVPIILNIDYLLNLWLGEPPIFTNTFIVFLLIAGMISNIAAGFDASIQATGKIKKNQIGFSIINLSLLPIIFFLYKIGVPPYWNTIVMVLLAIITIVFQCGIMSELTNFKISDYFHRTLLPCLFSTLAAILPLYCIKFFLSNSQFSSFPFLIASAIWTLTATYFCGVNQKEKDLIKSFISTKMAKF